MLFCDIFWLHTDVFLNHFQIEQDYHSVTEQRCDFDQFGNPAYCWQEPKYTDSSADFFDGQGAYYTRLMYTLEQVVDHLVPKDGENMEEIVLTLEDLINNVVGGFLENALER